MALGAGWLKKSATRATRSVIARSLDGPAKTAPSSRVPSARELKKVMLCDNVLAIVVERAGFPAVLVSRRWRAATTTTAADVADAHQSLPRYRLAKTAGLVLGRPTDEAARHGSLDILKWERARGCDWGWRTCALAAKGGHLEVLRWARANGCDWNWATCAWAAGAGHLEVLKWARANGCDWDALTCAWAAEGGHLEVLEWARANGCDWDDRTCARAAEGGHLEVLKWAPRHSQMGPDQWLRLGRPDLRESGRGRVPRGFKVGAGQWLRLGPVDLRVGGRERPP